MEDLRSTITQGRIIILYGIGAVLMDASILPIKITNKVQLFLGTFFCYKCDGTIYPFNNKFISSLIVLQSFHHVNMHN